MSKWPRVLLGDVAPIVRRSVAIQPSEFYTEIGVRSFFRGIFHRRNVQGSDFTWQKIFLINSGDIVFSNLMAWEKGIGLAGAGDAGCIGNHRMLTCEPDLSRAIPEFLFSYCQTPEFFANIEIASPGSIARNKTLSPDGLQAIRVPLPPLDAQRRIVERLHAVSTRLKARAEAAERQQADLTAMLDAAYKQICVDAPRMQLREVAPLVKRPVTIDQNESYTEFGIRSFYRGLFQRRTLSGSEFTWQSLYRIESGDLVFSNIMAWEKAIALVDEADAHCVGNHRMLICKPDRSRIVPGALFFYFTTQQGFAQIDAGSPGSIARNKTLSPDALQAIDVPVPSLDAQEWFEKLRTKVAALRTHQAAISADVDALLPAMLAQIFN